MVLLIFHLPKLGLKFLGIKKMNKNKENYFSTPIKFTIKSVLIKQNIVKKSYSLKK